MVSETYEPYITANTFLPMNTINLLKSNTAWGVDSDGWETLILKLEKKGVSVIRASVNFKHIEEDKDLIKELLTLFIQAQLLIPLINANGLNLLEDGEALMDQFNKLIERIRENQKRSGIGTEEDSTGVAGLTIF